MTGTTRSSKPATPKLSAKIVKHTIRMARGSVWHDLYYEGSATPTTSLPHMDALPCERCLAVEATTLVRFVRELVNGMSLESARASAKLIFVDKVPNIDALLQAIEYKDGEVRYSV